MIATLRKLGEDTISKITLEMCHLPLVSRERYTKYKEYMKSIDNGWYLNTQSNSETKYLQLKAINNQLSLGLKLEIGAELETQHNPNKDKRTKAIDKLLVRFPNGEYYANDNAIDTFLEVIWQIGVEKIRQKDLSWGDKPLITTTKIFNNQVQVGKDHWIIVPNTTKDKVKLLRVIGAMLHINLNVQTI